MQETRGICPLRISECPQTLESAQNNAGDPARIQGGCRLYGLSRVSRSLRCFLHKRSPNQCFTKYASLWYILRKTVGKAGCIAGIVFRKRKAIRHSMATASSNTCMYLEYFKLNEPPFSLTPDPRFLYMSERHREGLAHLFYGVQASGGFVQLTGEIGAGKTTLCRCLVKQMPPDTDVALILNPRLTASELLETVCDELGMPHPAEKASIKLLIDALNRHLLESHSRRRRTVLIIDEAQNLDMDVLEQIRLLTNLETSREKLLQIILLGQPELLSILKRKGLRQLTQRITARYHLEALSRRETYAYIQHRLAVAGGREPLFASRAMRRVYRLSRGSPRLINIICDRALLGTYASDKKAVSAGIVRRAARETQGIIPWYRKIQPEWVAGILALALVLAGIMVFLKSPGYRGQRPAAAVKSENSGSAISPAIAPVPVLPSAAAENLKPDIVALPPAAAPPKPAPPAGPSLAEVLGNPALRGKARDSFTSLFARWGAEISLGPSDYGCRVARAHGFECLFLAGNWAKLRRYDLPAILELELPDGTRHRVTLLGLGTETAKISIGDRTYACRLSEINELWDGSIIMIWKPPFAARNLSPGSRGEEVRWVRQALDQWEGKLADPSASDLYDEDLRKRVIKFQGARSLAQSGLVSTETLVRMTTAAAEPKGPSIARNSP